MLISMQPLKKIPVLAFSYSCMCLRLLTICIEFCLLKKIYTLCIRLHMNLLENHDNLNNIDFHFMYFTKCCGKFIQVLNTASVYNLYCPSYCLILMPVSTSYILYSSAKNSFNMNIILCFI